MPPTPRSSSRRHLPPRTRPTRSRLFETSASAWSKTSPRAPPSYFVRAPGARANPPRMQFGVTMFCTDRSMGIVDLARAVEERGFHSLFVPEHSHIPTSRKTPYPLGGDLPDEYRRTVDPFVALGAAATVTSRLRLGTGICLVAQRDPIHTAKEAAT